MAARFLCNFSRIGRSEFGHLGHLGFWLVLTEIRSLLRGRKSRSSNPGVQHIRYGLAFHLPKVLVVVAVTAFLGSEAAGAQDEVTSGNSHPSWPHGCHLLLYVTPNPWLWMQYLLLSDTVCQY